MATSPPADAPGRRLAGRAGVVVAGLLGALGAGAILHFAGGQLAEGPVGFLAWAGVVAGTSLGLVGGLWVVARVKKARLAQASPLLATAYLLCLQVAITTAAAAAMRPAGGRFVLMVLSVMATVPAVAYARASLTPQHESERPIQDAVDL
jgi:hypothetical protein